jgi:hypothetical protein
LDRTPAKILVTIRDIAGMGAAIHIVAGSRDEHTTLGESEELYTTARGIYRHYRPKQTLLTAVLVQHGIFRSR